MIAVGNLGVRCPHAEHLFLKLVRGSVFKVTYSSFAIFCLLGLEKDRDSVPDTLSAGSDVPIPTQSPFKFSFSKPTLSFSPIPVGSGQLHVMCKFTFSLQHGQPEALAGVLVLRNCGQQ